MATTTATRATQDTTASAAGGRDDGEDRGHLAGLEALNLLITQRARGASSEAVVGRSSLRMAGNLLRHPERLARRGVDLGRDLLDVALGRSDRESQPDARFADDAWAGNPLLRRMSQAYQAADDTLAGLVEDAELDWHDEKRVRFALHNVVQALAPTNLLATNPTAIKALVDSGGANLVEGLRNLAKDLRSRPRIPAKIEPDAFTVGEDLAVTPGEVVHRTELFELIQYAPSTDEVHATPLLCVPPMINKYYIADLAPGRSIFEHVVGEGHRLFAISWRNPDERHAEWDLDTYAGGVVEALEVIAEITGQDTANVVALCAGGIVTSLVANHLFATDRGDRIGSLTLGVCVLDQDRNGTAGALLDRATATAAIAASRSRGYVDGADLAEVFAWLRPNDLIWRYWVNNYLLGKQPPAFDVLAWNADTTRMPAGLHADFVRLALDNALVGENRTKVLGSGTDLSRVDTDLYVVAGITDHISPWRDAYASAQLFGSSPRFVLSNSGHIVSMVNPPGSKRASFRTNPEAADEADPDTWLDGAETQEGSWWVDWTEWLSSRSGELVAAPEALGSEEHPPITEAPGTYVLQS